MFNVIERRSTLQGVATIPEFVWELSFGIYLIVNRLSCLRFSQETIADLSHRARIRSLL
jgi:hypothetical protein